MKILFSLAFIISLLTISCNKDNDNTGNGNSSRVIKYEITGNFTGSLIASYTTASGSTANEQVTTLPWTKEITYASGVTAAIIAASGNGGGVGQQVTVVVKKAGVQVSSTTAIADNAGGFTKSSPVVIF